jgi:RNA polymerase sigma-70 factor (ECF subfamily)
LSRYSSLSAEGLVKACAGSSDPVAWDEFFRRFHPLIAAVVLRTARRWVEPPHQLIDDLTQDAFLKLCDDDSRLLRTFVFRHEDAFFGFLKKVAANVTHDHFKSQWALKRGADKTDPIPDQGGLEPADAGRNSSDGLERAILLRQVGEVMDRAFTGEDKKRNGQIFWLHHRHGMSASEIAALPYGLNTKGIETLLRRMLIVIQSHTLKGKGNCETPST